MRIWHFRFYAENGTTQIGWDSRVCSREVFYIYTLTSKNHVIEDDYYIKKIQIKFI